MSIKAANLACPKCNGAATAVLEKRGPFRRRRCKVCGHRFNTQEVIRKSPTSRDRRADLSPNA